MRKDLHDEKNYSMEETVLLAITTLFNYLINYLYKEREGREFSKWGVNLYRDWRY